MSLPLLPLKHLAERHVGLTPEIAASYFQAAQVCLDLHHVPPTEFVLRDDSGEIIATVDWEPAGEQSRNAWANQTDATENGAYACALAAVELMKGLFAVRRAETLTGADFYVAPAGKRGEDLEECFRLEISGTRLSDAGVKSRLRQKIKQAAKGQSNLPALAAVVGFKARLIVVQKVGEEL
jgi:hypothetical protein